MNKERSALTKFFQRHLPIQEQINFTRHLSITIKAGLPIYEGLKIIKKQSGSRRFKKILDRVITDINNGQSLASSLARHAGVFDDFFINIIGIGETSGTLAENLLYLAEELKKRKALKSKVRSALIYPSVILVATVGIAMLLVFFIFPKVLPIFKSLRINLPLTTRMLILISTFLIDYWPWVLGGAFAIVIFLRFILFVPGIRFLFHRLLTVIPVVSSLTVNVNIANFSRVMAVLLKSGVKIVEAATIASTTLNNLVYRRTLAEAAVEVQRGEQLSHLLSSRLRLFPILFANMVEIGENTGNLQENLFYLSEYYTDEVDVTVKNLTTLLEPMLLLTMGLIVGFIALSIITPIYEVTSGLKI